MSMRRGVEGIKREMQKPEEKDGTTGARLGELLMSGATRDLAGHEVIGNF